MLPIKHADKNTLSFYIHQILPQKNNSLQNAFGEKSESVLKKPCFSKNSMISARVRCFPPSKALYGTHVFHEPLRAGKITVTDFLVAQPSGGDSGSLHAAIQFLKF
jgi:hypothetical protein